MTINCSSVEAWLEDNQDWFVDYALKKLDLSLINKWLTSHGYSCVHDSLTVSRGNMSQDSSEQNSPSIGSGDSGFFSEKSQPEIVRHQRSNSKKYLRHDFARSKRRNLFRTHEAAVGADRESRLAERRSSLKGMRQFLSLPPTSGTTLSLLIQSKVRLPQYASKDIEIKRELRSENEREFFMEIVKDISHDLDLKSLTSRILTNLCILLQADHSSLFFVEGPKGKQTLVSKVFDMYTGTNCYLTSMGDNMVIVPWGEGIIGHVAETGNLVNTRDASKDHRFKDEVDRMLGACTNSLLCVPVLNADSEVIAVAQVINKHGPEMCFTKDDEKLMSTYLAFCGMAISNAQAFETYTREYDRNKALLEVVHFLFEEQTSVEGVVKRIMERAKTLLQCEHCVVLLKHCHGSLHLKEESLFSQIFELHHVPSSSGSSSTSSSPATTRRQQKDIHSNKIAELVATSGETVNISDFLEDERFHTEGRREDGSRPGTRIKSVLCKPIRNNRSETIGVAQLINKKDGKVFDEYDDQLFEAFTIFCGLGINNCQLYDELARSAAQQAVSLEVLAYHATVSNEQVDKILIENVPTAHQWNLYNVNFNDYSLSSDNMVLAAVRIFTDAGLIDDFSINYETLVRWILAVRKNYRNIAYHNWRHAFNVTQFMFSLLMKCGMRHHLQPIECLALLVACLCHDLDHRGTNNAFQQKSSSPLAQLYGTQATMEQHHFNQAVLLLNSEGLNIFSKLSSQEYSFVMTLLKEAIIATDLSLHIQVRREFIPLVESGLFNWEEPEQRKLLRSTLMTACDIATITKSWDVQRKAADLVVSEFFEQGDMEKNVLKIQPQVYMDRERHGELPRLQLEWIDGICLPLYKTLAQMNIAFKPLLVNVLQNREHWEILDQERLAKSVMRQTDV